MLRFDPDRHEYFLDDDRLPSVTEVLDPLAELDGIPHDVLAAAAAFGSNVHAACHLFNQGRLDESALDPALRPYLKGWKQYLHDASVTVIASEIRCHHPRARYAGTADAVVRPATRQRFGPKQAVVDIKSSLMIPRTVDLQLAAYRAALLDGPYPFDTAMDRYCVHLLGDGRYSLVRCLNAGDFNVFLSALNLHRWRMRADA